MYERIRSKYTTAPDLDGVAGLVEGDGAAAIHVELPEQPVAVVLRPEASTVSLSAGGKHRASLKQRAIASRRAIAAGVR